MNTGIELVSTNLGMEIQLVILIVVLLGDLIFYADSFLKGIVFTFFTTGGLFMLCYAFGWDYSIIFKVFMVTLIAMALSLYAVGKSGEAGGLV
jgi:hypothetical protein